MAKILLVEDDNNLREIYEARLQAEGYMIVSAMDGEEALVVAKKEKPDLVISDVMMPRISGFEMLDILRNTEGLKDVKIIMLTALGQAEDKTRADSLGADRYLVKSQVTLEDIVKAAQELLGPNDTAPSAPQATAAAAEQSAALAAATTQPAGVTAPAAPAVTAPSPTATPAVPVVSTASIPVVAPPPADQPEPATAPAATPSADATDNPPAAPTLPGSNTAAPAAPQPTTPSPTPDAAQAAVPVPAAPTTPTVPDVPVVTPTPITTTTPDTPTEQPPTGIPTPTAPPEPPVATPPAPEPPTLPAAQTEPAETSASGAPQPTPVVTPTPPPAIDTPSAPELTPPISAEPAPDSAPTTPTTPDTVSAPDIATAEPTPATTESAIPPVNSVPSDAQSASAEEAAIKAQIESFVNQNSQTAPKPVGETVMADAIKDLVSDTIKPTPAATTAPKVIMPSTQHNPASTAPDTPRTPDASESSSVAVAHKKIIRPITNAADVQPVGLDELLAKEGITNLDEEGHPLRPGTSPTTNPALPTQPTTSGLPATPHPPGHVISPNGGTGGVDPNSIAL